MTSDEWYEDQRRRRRKLHESREDRPVVPTSPAREAEQRLASVVVVCWNAAETITRCLEQLAAQDHPNFEVIVVDDGSTDATATLAERALRASSGRILRSRRNLGCSHARNVGLREARGDVVAFIDADGFADRAWLRHLVATFEVDPAIGGAASVVFLDRNPMVLNGAGGTVNRQGWAADLSMGESYEHARIASTALYPMGCGMALRRSAVERVGPFDERMRNYYDDVDYGIRLWRAGYRVVVAGNAWVDHGFGEAGEDRRKRLLCERHRTRVVLKHITRAHFGRWLAEEARSLRRAPRRLRTLKLVAMAWNLSRIGGPVASRWRLRRAPHVPPDLIDDSWGDGFPAGRPELSRPRPDSVGATLEIADAGADAALLYGWFPLEGQARRYRWAAPEAAALLRCTTPVRRLRLDFAHVPVDTGGVEVSLRRLGPDHPLEPVWSGHLPWQYSAGVTTNQPALLDPGDYELSFHARGWLEPPQRTRSLGLSLMHASLATLEPLDHGGLDMASASADEQVIEGWYEHEASEGRSYRWAGRHAAAIVRAREDVCEVCVCYRLPPVSEGGVNLVLSPLEASGPRWSGRLEGGVGWQEARLPAAFGAGDYVLSFEAEQTWSNPTGAVAELPPENRSLGFALTRLTLVYG